MNIYIGEPVVVSDMQGPAPDGFHVPLSSEWQAIYDAYTGLGLSGGANFSTYLKIPIAGFRSCSNLSLYNRGLQGPYWSSTPYSASQAYRLFLSSSNVNPQDYYSRSYGFCVRCVQNFPTTPTNSWTVLYQGSGSAGIFHNPTDGLISISSDGNTWYTIMDKNLGATTVYNYGDTMTEANCGKVYQRGNNYGFSGDANYDTSLISQSSTQVNVTGYGPGNYYESSIWITTNPRQSSASNGNNLRGGVSQGISTKSVEVQNIYIGEYVPLITTPGIYHNATDGLISYSSNGTTWYTLSDKNLGATTVFNYGDTLSQNNCGKFYQRGNNYGFPRTGSVTTSSSQVNASSYGPNNYYSNSTFRTSSSEEADWSSSKNDNLWGNTTNTSVARRGPCDEGFHVPKSNEMYTVLNGLYTMTGSPSTNVFIEYIQRYLLIPLAGFRAYNGSASDSTRSARLRTSSVYNTYAYGAFINQSSNQPNQFVGRINGYSIRPFKNEAVQPTEDWTVLYQPS